MKLAISYIRFSSAHQGKGSTTERQQAMIDAWLLKHPDYKLSKLSAKDEGKSAFKGEHLEHGLGGILEAVRGEEVPKGSALLIEALDRLGRLEPLSMITIMGELIKAGIEIHTLEDGQIYNSETVKSGELFILVGKIQQAHQYSLNLSRRILAAYERKRRMAREGKGITLYSPLWLETNGRLKQLESEAVRECINLYLKGYGTRRILIELGDKYAFLNNVHPSTLKRWFSNKAIIGDWNNKGDIINKVFEPLIDVSTYYQLQRLIKERQMDRTPERKYKLSGIVRCACCKNPKGENTPFHFRRKMHNGSEILYANCAKYLQRGQCENNKTIPYEILEYIFDQTANFRLGGFAMEEVNLERSKEIETLRAQLVEVKSQLNNLIDLWSRAPSKNLNDKIVSLTEEINLKEKAIQHIELCINETDYDEDGDVLIAANKALDEYDTNPELVRRKLIQNGYRIYVDHARISADGPFGTQIFTYVKRSTAFKCFIVQATIPQHTIISSDDEAFLIPEYSYHMAINRSGIPHMAPTQRELEDELRLVKEGKLCLTDFMYGRDPYFPNYVAAKLSEYLISEE